MSKEQINIRASGLTVQQLDDLTDALGMSRTETLTVAIDHLHREMLDSDLPPLGGESITVQLVAPLPCTTPSCRKPATAATAARSDTVDGAWKVQPICAVCVSEAVRMYANE